MTNTLELDRAIDAAKRQLTAQSIRDAGWDFAFARALVSELLRGMEPPEWFTTDEDCGFNAALAEIKRRAGIVEGEV